MKRYFVHGTMLAAALTLSLGTATRPALAGNIMFATASACLTKINCKQNKIGGTIIHGAGSINDPWQGQIYGQPGECIRLDVSFQGTDTQMVLVSPDGTVWRNDDRTGGDLRPLIEAVINDQGWYTVQVGNFLGAGPSTDFTLRYSRYFGAPAIAFHCPSPTSTLSSPQHAKREAAAPAAGPAASTQP